MEMIPIRGKHLGVRPPSISGSELHMANPSPAAKTLPTTTAAAKAASKYTTENLAYPLNVEGDPQQGHYISFYARVTDPAKLKAYKEAKATIEKVQKTIAAEVGASAAASGMDFGGGRTKNQIEADTIAKIGVDKYSKAVARTSGNTGSGVKSNSIQLQNGTTTRLKTAISLYMPPSVQVSYESKYGDENISMLAETGYNAIKGFMTGNSTKEQVMSVLEDSGQIVKQMALAALETAAPGGKALFAIESGKVITPKMELMFEGIGRRNFSFSFVLIPKSAQEAEVIKKIVKMFKVHMAADYVDGSSREMSFPDMFDIEYMYLGTRNPNLNKIATCALTKMDVEYGGDRYVAYEGGVPQTTKISLNFNEFDIITKKHIEDGY